MRLRGVRVLLLLNVELRALNMALAWRRCRMRLGQVQERVLLRASATHCFITWTQHVLLHVAACVFLGESPEVESRVGGSRAHQCRLILT